MITLYIDLSIFDLLDLCFISCYISLLRAHKMKLLIDLNTKAIKQHMTILGILRNFNKSHIFKLTHK